MFVKVSSEFSKVEDIISAAGTNAFISKVELSRAAETYGRIKLGFDLEKLKLNPRLSSVPIVLTDHDGEFTTPVSIFDSRRVFSFPTASIGRFGKDDTSTQTISFSFMAIGYPEKLEQLVVSDRLKVSLFTTKGNRVVIERPRLSVVARSSTRVEVELVLNAENIAPLKFGSNKIGLEIACLDRARCGSKLISSFQTRSFYCPQFFPRLGVCYAMRKSSSGVVGFFYRLAPAKRCSGQECWRFTGQTAECSDVFPPHVNTPQFCAGGCTFDNGFLAWICDDRPDMMQYEDFDTSGYKWDGVEPGGTGDYLLDSAWPILCYEEADCQCVGGFAPTCVVKLRLTSICRNV